MQIERGTRSETDEQHPLFDLISSYTVWPPLLDHSSLFK